MRIAALASHPVKVADHPFGVDDDHELGESADEFDDSG